MTDRELFKTRLLQAVDALVRHMYNDPGRVPLLSSTKLECEYLTNEKNGKHKSGIKVEFLSKDHDMVSEEDQRKFFGFSHGGITPAAQGDDY